MNLMGLLIGTALAATSAIPEGEANVREANRRFDRAQLARDFPAIEALLTADFTWVTFAGATMNRSETLEHLRKGDSKYTRYESVDVKVRLLGDVALVTGLLVREGRNSRRDLTGRFLYTRVFVKQERNWRLTHWQVTPVAEAERAVQQ